MSLHFENQIIIIFEGSNGVSFYLAKNLIQFEAKVFIICRFVENNRFS